MILTQEQFGKSLNQIVDEVGGKGRIPVIVEAGLAVGSYGAGKYSAMVNGGAGPVVFGARQIDPIERKCIEDACEALARTHVAAAAGLAAMGPITDWAFRAVLERFISLVPEPYQTILREILAIMLKTGE